MDIQIGDDDNSTTIGDLLSNGEYGILCSDYEQMYQCIKDLALSPILLTELSNKALSRRKWFGVKVALDQLYNLL